AAGELRRHLVRQAGRAEVVTEHAFDDQRQTEGEQQTVEVVEPIEPLQKGALDDDTGDADDDRRDDERDPIVQTGILQQEERREGAQHVLGAMGEVDDVEHAEDDGETEAQERVERAVDQPEQELTEQSLGRNAENLEHARSLSLPRRGRVAERSEAGWGINRETQCPLLICTKERIERLHSSPTRSAFGRPPSPFWRASRAGGGIIPGSRISGAPLPRCTASGTRKAGQPLTSGQPPSFSGRNASLAGMVARRL